MTIEPRGKLAYLRTPQFPGCNVAIGYDGRRTIVVDVDTKNITHAIDALLHSTLSWETPKGFAFVLRGPVPRWFIESWRFTQMLRNVNASFGRGPVRRDILRKFVRNGIKDPTALHGLFKNLDGLTYCLIPPSVSCVYHGRTGPVRNHSTHSVFCNMSPDGLHHFFERRFINVPEKLVSFSNFLKVMNVEPLAQNPRTQKPKGEIKVARDVFG